MSHESLRPDEKAARDAVRGLPPPQADAAYRDRLRRSFGSGTIESRVRPSRIRPIVWGAPLAAAAAIVLAVVLNQGPRWELDGVSGSGSVAVDGRDLAVSERDAIGRAVRSGTRIRTSGDVQIDLRLPGMMALQIPPGSEAVIPTAPGRWFARTSLGEVTAGEVRFTTGPGLRGARLRISTPEAWIDVSGTTFAVIREPIGSCVCVLEGEVRMSSRTAREEVVRAGTRRYLFTDGRPPLVEPIRSMEVMKLTMLRDQAATQLGR